MKRFLTLFAALVASWSCIAAASPKHSLWFAKPAGAWEEAWPVGNGRIGAMVFGGTETEELQLNEETISTGGPYENWNPNGLQNLQKIRGLIFSGQYDAAQKLGGVILPGEDQFADLLQVLQAVGEIGRASCRERVYSGV